jgi:hypothetical protein
MDPSYKKNPGLFSADFLLPRGFPRLKELLWNQGEKEKTHTAPAVRNNITTPAIRNIFKDFLGFFW